MSAAIDLGMWRRHKVRLVRQNEVTECGLAALTMIANYHGLDVDLGTLRRRFPPSGRGTTLKSLIGVADALGFAARPVKLPLQKLRGLNLPAILHWDFSHHVVLERFANGRAFVHNPEGSSGWMTLDEISPHFTGVALELRPSADFAPRTMRASLRLSQLWHRITGLKRALVQTLVLTAVLEAFVLASPYYMQIAIDRALPARDLDLMTVLAVGFGLFTLVNAAALLLRSFVLLSAGTSLGYGISLNVGRHLFKLPIAWFERRHVGDILSRFQSVAPIQQFMTQGAVSTLIDGSLAIFTLILMLFYSVFLTLVPIVAFALYCLVRVLSFSAQRAAQEEVIVASGREQSTMIESVRGIVTLRLFSQEAIRHALWQSRLTDSTNANVSLLRIGIWQSAANTLIFGLEMIIAVWVATRLVLSTGFSIGMVFAFFTYKAQFLQRAASLIDQAIAFRMLGLHLERLSDIALSETDKSSSDDRLAGEILEGRIELRQVRYRYSPDEPLVLTNINLIVNPGDHIAITGPSGSGKSTIVKILLGLAEPESGEFLVDGVPLPRFGYRNYRAQAASVLQEDSLFSGTLADNIALFDEVPAMDEIIMAAKAAALHSDIMTMPMKYDTLVGETGTLLSGGQRQRLLLARAIYRRPKLLVLDEATSHLDSELERLVSATISEMGITRIVIAHRKETLSRAERVYYLKDGELIYDNNNMDKLRENDLDTSDV